MRKSKPNVVPIVVDQMRGDCLFHLGHPVVGTPWLDHLARDGVSCTRAYSAVPNCIAARAALLTGLSQNHHGRLGYQDRVPWDYRQTKGKSTPCGPACMASIPWGSFQATGFSQAA